MRQRINIPGLERQVTEVEYSALTGSGKMLVNGQPATPSTGRNTFLLQRDDGLPVTAQLKTAFPDPLPFLIVGDQTVHLAPPLSAGEKVWCFVPVVLILGGAIGGMLGGAAMMVNAQVLRADAPPAMRYAISALVTLAAFIIYFVAVALLQNALHPTRVPAAPPGFPSM